MKIIKYTVASLAMLFAASSCMNKFDEYNKNPNQMGFGEIPASGMLSELIYSTCDGLLYRTWQLNGELMQYTVSGNTTSAYHRYIISNGVMSSAWDHLARQASTADHMMQLARTQENVNQEAIATTIRTLLISNLTDIWGDIPFTEAFQMYGEQQIIQPKFDKQQDIYKQLFEDLERANSLYSTATKDAMDETDKGRDLLYGGDITKWKKFNNTLYIRLLMRLSNRDKVMGISTKLQAILNDPVKYPIFTSNDDSAILKFTGVSPFENRFGKETADSFNGRRMAEYIINLLDGTSDPRLPMIAKMSGSEWNGTPSGMPTQETDQTGSATLNKAVLGTYTSPYSIIKYDELLFILSEAAYRGMIPGGDDAAKQYYTEAVRCSVKAWDDMVVDYDVSDNTMENFLANVEYNSTLDCILTQKYVATFWVGYESWHDYRRTGYPQLTIGTGTDNNGVLPMRFQYPNTTQTTNSKNYQEAVARLTNDYIQGADNMRTPIWWGKAALELAKY